MCRVTHQASKSLIKKKKKNLVNSTRSNETRPQTVTNPRKPSNVTRAIFTGLHFVSTVIYPIQNPSTPLYSQRPRRSDTYHHPRIREHKYNATMKQNLKERGIQKKSKTYPRKTRIKIKKKKKKTLWKHSYPPYIYKTFVHSRG